MHWLSNTKKMLELDGVELEFDEGALTAIAKEAIERKTGARGLRSIIESTMLDVMYELPSREDVKKMYHYGKNNYG